MSILHKSAGPVWFEFAESVFCSTPSPSFAPPHPSTGSLHDNDAIARSVSLSTQLRCDQRQVTTGGFGGIMERVWLVLAIFAAFGTRGTYEDIITIPKGVIDDHCNQTVSNPQDVEDAGYVQTQTDLTDFLRVVGYDDNADCSITLVAPANHKFLIQWTQPIDFEYANGCQDWVRVHDGYENDTSLYDMGELCIFSSVEATDNLTKATTGNVVTVTVHTDSTASDNKGFKLLYTVFYDPDNGSCSGTDYLCSNDRCVSESLKCDFQNHCGDNSDESKTLASCPDLPDVIINFITNVLKLSVGAFIGICVAIGLVLILIIVLCICCCCKCCGCCQSTRAAPV